MMMYLGTAASPGIAIGRALVVKNEAIEVPRRTIQDAAKEGERLKTAIREAKSDLEKVRDHALQQMGQDKAAIFESHLMMLEDPEILEQTVTKIEQSRVNAEAAYKDVTQGFVEIFEGMTNSYMRERAADVRDVSERVLRKLLNQEKVDLADLNEDWVLVGYDFAPSDTATMNRTHVLGLLTDIGGRTSHTAIMARTLEIPAVVGSRNLSQKIQSGQLLILDGDTGEVIVNPDEATRRRFEAEKRKQLSLKAELEALRGQESVTRDGHHVELSGNIGTPADIEVLHKGDAEGVGLYRTEFLFMNRDSMPSEDEQFEAYRSVLSAMNSKPVIIRTLDIGGDKSLPYLKISQEQNPFLGYRAIRICLDQVDIFKTQLRALLRASAFGKLRVMFPMISGLEELLQARAIFDEVRQDLQAKSVPMADEIPVGIMIEVPSAAMMADILAKHVDFFSIGTNDLIQYTCAVDRMNEKIHHLYSPYNMGVLRLIQKVIHDGHAGGIWVGMCGEVAGELPLIPVLLGMGLDEFSMTPTSILKVRRLVRSLSYEQCQDLAKSVLSLASCKEAIAVTEKFLEDHFQKQ